MSGGEGPDFRTYLQKELTRRCRANPKYSVRAFARNLGLEPSALSKILRGKRRLTQKVFKRLATRLALSPQDYARYLPDSRLARAKRGENPPVPEYDSLSADSFEMISDWYHFSILELIQTDGFRPDVKWIAAALRVSPAEASIAVDRLFRLGFIEKMADGTWVDRSGSVSVYRDGFTSAALRKLLIQTLHKSIEAVEEVPIEHRDHSGIAMAIDSSKLPEARRRIQKFRRQLCEFLKGDGPPRDEVYHLSISLYPVSYTRQSKGVS